MKRSRTPLSLVNGSRWAGIRLLAPVLACMLLSLPVCQTVRPAWSATQKMVTPYLKAPSKNAPMDVVADTIAHNSDKEVSIATGNVFIVYGRYRLKADKIVYDRRRKLLKAIGNIWLREPNGNILRADDLSLDDKFKTGFANFVQLLMTNDAKLTAVYVRREEGPVSIFDQVTYTRCKTCVTSEGRPFWELKSDRATYKEKEHRIYHDNARMELLGVPVFWLPYLSHPDPQTKRASGFLVPTMGYSSTLGALVEIPYFWNLAPNYDITFRPRILTEQGLLNRAIWRHNTGDGEYEVDMSGIHQLNPNKLASPGDESLRGAVRSNGLFNINSSWLFGWNGTITSDDTYLRRYKIDSADDLNSTAFLTSLGDRNYFNTAVYHYRSTIETESDKTLPLVLPSTRSSLYFDGPVLGGELGLDTSAYALTRDVGVDASHFAADLHWQRQFINQAGMVITPFARLRGDFATSVNVADTTVPGGVRGKETLARIMPKAGLDIRWPFISTGQDAQHILTPAAQLVTATSERKANKISNEDSSVFSFDTTNLFLHDRFNGFDRFDGGTRADIGLVYNYLMDNGGFARFAVGESFRIGGQNSFATGTGLENTRSDFVASAAVRPWDGVNISYLGRFDAQTFDPKRQEVSAQLRVDRLSIAAKYGKFDASPAFTRPDLLHQVWTEAALELGENLHLFGGLRYAIKDDYVITNHVGIGYYCDCATIKLTYSEDHTRDRGVEQGRSVLLSVEFKTLGTAGVGSGVD